jgi:undecaprenyl pyrophosphate phosphatase UppP
VADTLNTITLGIIEGITEFLPISSTGHLLVAEKWLGARSELFNVAIQAGAILAIVLIYWRRLLALLTRFDEPENRDYLFKLTVAFAITAVLGLVVTKLGFKLPEKVMPIAIAELVGGILILIIEAYGDLECRHLGGLVSDSRGCFPGHLALGRHNFRGHARGPHPASRGDRVRLPGRHSDHVCRDRL